MLPYTRGGVVAAILLGLGRALGEAIAVTQVIGDRPRIHVDLFADGRHAGEPDRGAVPGGGFEPPGRVARSTSAVILLVISLIVNFAAQMIVKRFEIAAAG